MNTVQIREVLQADPYTRDVLVDVYPRDQLPRSVKKYPSAYVCNTDPRTEGGEHWISLYMDDRGRGEYFDSYGLPAVHKKNVNFMNTQCKSWIFNEKLYYNKDIINPTNVQFKHKVFSSQIPVY